MNDFSQKRAVLESELDDLREQLLAADEAYENAASESQRDAADQACQRLRRELRTRREELRSLNAERGSTSQGQRVKTQAAGK